MVRFTMLAVAILVLTGATNARGQDTDEVKRLKEKVELLQSKLETATLKIEKLQAENEQLKAGGAKDLAKKPSLSDLLPEGKTITGTMISAQTGKEGTVTFVITDRDGKKYKATTTTVYMGVTTNGKTEGEISGSQMTCKSVGLANNLSATLVLKGEELSGIVTQANGAKSKVAFSVGK